MLLTVLETLRGERTPFWLQSVNPLAVLGLLSKGSEYKQGHPASRLCFCVGHVVGNKLTRPTLRLFSKHNVTASERANQPTS